MQTETARAQCIFLDVVAFTKDRTVEAQSDVVAALNDVVRNAVSTRPIPPEDLILIPTGDGIAIALLDIPGVDVHLKLALEVLRLVEEHNEAAQNAMRRFEVRIGINENVDNIIQDINGRRNVAGAGISMAQRIMDQGDGGQLLVGQIVYDTLRQRESYYSCFRSFGATGKHGVAFPVHQFVAEGTPGLNTDVPSLFASRQAEAPKLSKLAGYYIAHAHANQAFLVSRKNDPKRDFAAVALLVSLADDSVEKSATPPHQEAHTKTWGAGERSFNQQYEHYLEMDFWPLADLAGLLEEKHLSRFANCFEINGHMTDYAFVSHSGVQKVQHDWPDLAREFGLGPPDGSKN